MSTIKVSALTALPVANATFVYGITNSSTEGKVPVGGSNGLAGLASPTFTGTPAAPSPSADDNSTLIATTAYVGKAVGYWDTDWATPSVPTTGGSVSINPASGGVITQAINPSGNLSALTVNIVPLNPSFFSGSIVIIVFTKAITTMSWGPGIGTAQLALPSTITANTTLIFGFDSNNSLWQRIL